MPLRGVAWRGVAWRGAASPYQLLIFGNVIEIMSAIHMQILYQPQVGLKLSLRLVSRCFDRLAWPGLAKPSHTRPSLAWAGQTRPGQATLGLAWQGLAWLGVGRPGLAWPGLDERLSFFGLRESRLVLDSHAEFLLAYTSAIS